MNKTIFITGASSGLGNAAAKLFQSKGWNVIATMRNPEKESGLGQLKNVTLLALDVTNAEQIDKTVQEVIASGEVDVVFNNAGYGLMGPLEALSDDQIIRQLNTNLLGVMRVTRAFIPYFRSRKSGIFITTTSIGGLVAFPLSSIYHATKWALEGWSEGLWHELRNFGISIKTVSPGGIKTDFGGRSLDFASAPEYDAMWKAVMSNFEKAMEGASTAEQIADVVYEAATDGKSQLRYVAGADAQALYKLRTENGTEYFMQYMNDAFLK